MPRNVDTTNILSLLAAVAVAIVMLAVLKLVGGTPWAQAS
jgi:hypothetical protein